MGIDPGKLPDIQQRFVWDDPNRYEWVVTGRGPRHRTGYWKFLHFAGPVIGPMLFIPTLSYIAMAFVTVFLAFVFGFVVYAIGVERLGGLDNILEPFKFWSGLGITALLIGWTVYASWQMWLGPAKKKAQAESHLHELLTTSIGIVAFVMSNQFGGGFAGSVESLGQWLLFFIQEAMRVILLDIPDVFDFRLTDIEANTWYARLGLVFFRFLIATGLVSSVWIFYQRRFQQEVVIGTVKECFWKCQYLLDRDTLLLKREGRIDSLAQPDEPVPVVEFLEALDEEDFREDLARKRPSGGKQ